MSIYDFSKSYSIQKRKQDNEQAKAQRRVREQYAKAEQEYDRQVRQAKESQQLPETKGGNWFTRLFNTPLELGGNFLSGLAKGVEGINDAAQGLLGTVRDVPVLGQVSGVLTALSSPLAGGAEIKSLKDNGRFRTREEIGEDIARDHVGEMLQNPMDEFFMRHGSYISADRAGDKWYDPVSLTRGVAQGAGQMVPAIAISAASGGTLAPLAMGTMAASAGGNSMEQALQDGGGYYSSLGYGAVQGGMEFGLEAATGGMGRLAQLGGKVPAKTIGKTIAKEALSEAFEEGVQEALTPLTKTIYKGTDALEEYRDPGFAGQVAQSALIGGTTGAVLQGSGMAVNARRMGGANNYNAVARAQSMTDFTRQTNLKQANEGLSKRYIQNATQTQSATLQQLSKNLQRMTPEVRGTLIQKYKLENSFNADGTLRAHSGAVTFNKDAVSYSLYNRVGQADGLLFRPTQNEVSPAAKQAIKNVQNMGRGTFQYVITDQLPAGQSAVLDTKTGIVYLSETMNVPKAVAAHEFTHTLEGTKAYGELARHIAQSVPEYTAKVKNALEIYKQVNRQYSPDVKLYEAKTEVIADYMGELLTSDKAVQRIVNQNKGLANRLWHRLKNLVDAGGKARAFYRKAETLFAAAIRSSEGGVQLSALEKGITNARYDLQQSLSTLAQYTQEDMSRITKRENSIIAKRYEDVVAFIKDARSGKNRSQLYLGKIDGKLGNIIKQATGLDLQGNSLVMDGQHIAHIFKTHGNAESEAARGQVAVTERNFENILDTIIAPDTVKLQQKETQQSLVFEKEIDGKYTSITLLSTKRGILTLKTAYINKNRRLLTPSHNADMPSANVQNKRGIAPIDNSISKTDKNVNTDQKGKALSAKEKDIRFALSKDAELKELLAVHNITEKKLLSALELGGFPMPSIAIIKDTIPFTSFGQISLIFNKQTIDPANKQNKVFSADAYTPKFPKTAYEVDEAKMRQIAKELEQRADTIKKGYGRDCHRFVYHVAEEAKGTTEVKYAARNKDGLAALYLQEIGKPLDEVSIETFLENDSAEDYKGYISWAEDLVAPIFGRKGIRNNKDLFTPSGNRRTWPQLYDAYTMDNVMRVMKQNGLNADEGFNYGLGTLRAALLSPYKSTAQIKADAKKLVDKKSFESVKEQAEAKYSDLLSSLSKYSNERNSFIAFDRASESLLEAARAKKFTIEGLKSEYKYGFDVEKIPESLLQEALDFMQSLKEMPTEYFEAKPQRAVSFREVYAAVVPEDLTPSTVKALEDRGIKVIKYPAGEEEASRQTALQSLPQDVRFKLEQPNTGGKAQTAAPKREKITREQAAARKANALTNSILDAVQSIRDRKNKKYVASDILLDDRFRAFQTALGRIKYRSDINKSGTRRMIDIFSQFYNEGNEALEGYLDSNVLDAINLIKEQGQSKRLLSYDELQAVNVIVKAADHLFKTYDTMFREGKRVSVTETAENGYSQVLQYTVKPENRSFLAKVLDGPGEYLKQVIEPRVVMMQLDGYAENGVFQSLFQDLIQGETQAGLIKINLLEPLGQFVKQNKGYKRRLTKETVSVGGKDIPVGRAITLYLTAKQEHAHAGLRQAGYGFYDKGKWVDNGTVTVQEAEAIKQQFTEADQAFVRLVRDTLKQASKIKKDTDLIRMGYTNVVEGDAYFPIRRYDGTVAKDMTTIYIDELNTLGNMSINKERQKGAKNKLQIDNVWDVLQRHADLISTYGGLSIPVDNFNRVYNKNLGDRANVKSLRTLTKEKVWHRSETYIKNLLADVQGIRNARGVGDKLINYIRSSFAKYQLGANLKVIVSQTASYPTAGIYLDPGIMAKGFVMKTDYKQMDQYCGNARVRNFEKSVVKAEGVIDKLGSFGDKLTKPIQWTDRFTIGKLWNAAQLQVQKEHRLKRGTEQNLTKAAELLEEIIRNTQPNYTVLERSALMRAPNELAKSFTMFTSVPLKQLSRLVEALGEQRANNQRAKQGDERAKAKKKRVNKKVRRAIASVAAANLMYVLIAQFFNWLYNRDRKDKDGEDIGFFTDLSKDFASTTMGMFPVLSDIFSFFVNGYEINNFLYGTVNDLLLASSDLATVVEKIVTGQVSNSTDFMQPFRKTIYAIGQLTGIPVRNLYNLFEGILGKFSPQAAYQTGSLFYNNNSYKQDMTAAMEAGNTAMAKTIAGVEIKKRGITDKTVAEELSGLATLGASVMPKKIQSNTLSYNGVEYDLSDKQLKAFKEVALGYEDVLAKMISGREYAALDNAQKEKAISFVQEWYYAKAFEDILQVERMTAKQLLANEIPLEDLAVYLAVIASLESDKDVEGNTVSGSRKGKVEAYVGGLRISAGQKTLLL